MSLIKRIEALEARVSDSNNLCMIWVDETGAEEFSTVTICPTKSVSLTMCALPGELFNIFKNRVETAAEKISKNSNSNFAIIFMGN